MAIYGIIASILTLLLAIELTLYAFLLPDSSHGPLKTHPLEKRIGQSAYITAYILSLLRAPLGLLPYLTKLFIIFILNIPYDSPRSTYFREVVNMFGDFLNLGLTTLLVLLFVGPLTLQPLNCIFYLPIVAELMRILAERVPITFSALWQLLPHRSFARTLKARSQSSIVKRYFARYCRYYALDDDRRAAYVLRVLKYRSSADSDLSHRLSYLQSFRIIPLQYGLRGGKVRDVAKGEVFIHGPWTNDPWLLIGMAMRRSPWIFDPRYLRRPFYYMTEANRLATLLVLEHARYSLPYAVFQFGHEIRVARLHLFYALLRCLGLDIEYKVSADGTFQFDQLICALEKRFYTRGDKAEQWPLSSDDEVIADILCNHSSHEPLMAMDIAERYTYPLKYVDEVLMKQLRTDSRG
jgi:hypothetical protein